ncbi:DUF58 domain-containing protein [Gardnerella leopoldii]|uniref:DUF58 domain-containing protein n=1 Tax=Gardnerella TaxID=2701 RepID=UPI0039EFEF22
MMRTKRLVLSEPAKAVRRKIELLDQRIDLPIARKALGLLEGDHPSHRRFGTGDVIDVHAWQPGDEARMMNWSASARTGQPMVSSRERTSSSHTWIALDTSINMNGACVSEESLYEVASNSACFFASLSLKRHDAVSLLCADGKNVINVHAASNFSDFERNLDYTLLNTRKNTRDIDALLTSLLKNIDNNGLVVLITDEYALQAHNAESLRKITQNHKLVVIVISPINPFDSAIDLQIFDGITLRKVPAFLKKESNKNEVEARRNIRINALYDMLLGVQSSIIHGSSSEEVFHISAQKVSRTNYLADSFSKEVE